MKLFTLMELQKMDGTIDLIYKIYGWNDGTEPQNTDNIHRHYRS